MAAASASGSAEALTAPPAAAPLTVVVEPESEPGGTLPVGDERGPGRFCLGMFPGQREQVGQARAFLAAFLGGWARVDEAVLLIGELGANAVVHTGSGAPGGLFTVRATLAGPWLRAEVEDQGSSWNGRLEEAECPHGLFLLRQLATQCGTRRARGGWVTWFVLGEDTITPVSDRQSGRSGINPVDSPGRERP
jgi:anti-sigma regulatory factor (Ser/Thr protein kinase)